MKNYTYDDFENNWMGLPELEYKALRYVEIHGILNYYIKDSTLFYYESYRNEGNFKHMINLKDMSHSSKQVKFIRKPYKPTN